jgi:hypothetical protein
MLIAAAALVACARDNSDPPGGYSGLIIYTDELTGCQYLARPSLNGAPSPLTPRQRADGTQVCEQGGLVR